MLHLNSWESSIQVLIIILVGGLSVAKLTERPRIPDVAAFLLFGILIGPAILNWVSEPNQAQLNQWILNVGALLILFDGGRGVQFSVLKKVWISILMLVTAGVLLTALVVGIAAHYLLAMPWTWAILLGSILASTDPATLIPVFKRVSLIPKLQQTVEAESAFNDATGSVLVFTIISLIVSHKQFSLAPPILSFLHSSIVGMATGAFFGLVCLWLVSRRGWGIFHEYGSIVMLATALSSFEVATLLHSSGFMAAFAAGMMTGNGESFRLSMAQHTRDNVDHFGNGITLIMRMLIFVLLGTQVDFKLIYEHLWMGLVVVAIFMVIARPLTVLSSVLIDRRAKWNRRQVTFMCWVRETGVIPAALSGMIVAEKVPGAPLISSITFMAILLTILVQASTTGWVATRLRVLQAFEMEEI
ncbi:sodium:proton antiporter [Alicyclobacillus sp. SO9]|uniref:cation:proton antiporter n=1 Tax=Alicyclobacillus sp. SO9 TaxID=2665646 RepID=UPI0018E8EFE6|nr:sodium:proton antiporter [Alicyclobacillus sp. SO9]QQE77092.1 sodium:proton antiporter [Alicyclobacillus sp. SO9]